jgi:hypothetical protein
MTPRTDNPFADLATGAFAWTFGIALLGYMLTIFARHR